MNAAAKAGMTRVIIPSVQRFDTDATGQVVNMVRHAGDLHLECIPVDDLVAATETTMNDPLPDMALDSSVPKYSNDVATYIDDFAHREQSEAAAGLKFAPKESDLAGYPPYLAATWKSVYADFEAGGQAYRAGQVYAAYQLFCRANGRMNGANALAGQTRAGFDVKTALEESDDLHDHLRILMNPPSIDQGGLESAVLVAEMADWAYGINASLEGAQLLAKQAFSQRSDATEAEKDRAREAILFADEQCKYLLTQGDFYTGLLAHLSTENPVGVDENAAHLLPQLIPAQLATARSFTDGIRASDLRDGLLFDPRLVAYVNVLRQVKADWDAHQRKKESEAGTAANAQAAASSATPGASDAGSIKLNSNTTATTGGFDPGDTYRPPHTVVATTAAAKKLSDAALCLIWVNHDCEIATLDEKYLRLGGTMDPATHEWRLKDRGKLDALLQMAEIGARHGIAIAEKAEIDPSVLAMIYEKAAHERLQGDDASALDALRNYWRCALLGNVCWQLAHTPKAQPVDLSSTPTAGDNSKTASKDGKKNDAPAVAKGDEQTNKAPVATPAPTASTNEVVVVNPPSAQTSTNEVVTPVTPPAGTNTVAAVNVPAAPIATNDIAVPVAPIATNQANSPAPPPTPPVPPVANASTTNSISPPTPPVPPAPPPTATASDDTNGMNIPVAPIAKVEDYAGNDSTPATNPPPAAPIPPVNKPVNDNADGHAGSFP
jgi:hypothetical protein